MSKRRNLIGRSLDVNIKGDDDFVTVRPRLTSRKSRMTRSENRVGSRYEGLAQKSQKSQVTDNRVIEIVQEVIDPQITCLFCKIPESVFPSPTIKGRWDCKNCSAYFLDRNTHPNAGKQLGVIQDFAIMYLDKERMGCVIVYSFEGDISPQTVAKAEHFKAALRVSPMEGFNQLTKDFISRLWCLTGGKPYLDDEVIFEACRDYAYEQSAVDEHERLSQMLFAQNVIGKIDSNSLRSLHEVIAAIPKSNGNLMRYYIAEGQEEFILLGLRKVYEQAVRDGQSYTARLAQGLCC